MSARVYLVGDDEALDHLSELCRHLPVFELARVDDVPDPLPEQTIVVIGARHPRHRDALIRAAMERGPLHLVLVPTLASGEHAGARALVTAAELVHLLVPELDRARLAES
ncbi:MAG: hypothetical protein ABI321_02770 [Polyangia bacterium]